jgi:hypothetical protein
LNTRSVFQCGPVYHGQIALRFPGTLCSTVSKSTGEAIPSPWWDKCWHIDGLHSEHTGIPKGSITNFTCLVGVLLADVTEEFSGNLCVFPRSHHMLEKYFRENGFQVNFS